MTVFNFTFRVLKVLKGAEGSLQHFLCIVAEAISKGVVGAEAFNKKENSPLWEILNPFSTFSTLLFPLRHKPEKALKEVFSTFSTSKLTICGREKQNGKTQSF